MFNKKKIQMCVSKFREYCNASRFEHEHFCEHVNDKNIEVKKGSWLSNANGKRYHYVTDLKQMKKLAESGNAYAVNHLKT